MSVNSKMTALADAIRAKTGGTDSLTLDGMAEAVAGIEAGGGGGGFPNGTEWTRSNIGTSVSFVAALGTGGWLACDSSRKYYVSQDGKTWSDSAFNFKGTPRKAFQFKGVDILYTYGDGGIYVLTEGSWKQAVSSYYIAGIAASDSLVLSIENDPVTKRLRMSSDGVTWTHSNSPNPSVAFRFVAYGGGVWLLGFDDGTTLYSNDGATWAQGGELLSVTKVGYVAGRWIAATSSGLWYSTDGTSWTQSNITKATHGLPIYSNGLFVAPGTGGYVYRSSDGMTWTSVYVGYTGYNETYMGYSNGVYVYSAAYIGLSYSVDGVSWEKSNVADATGYHVLNDDGVWVAGCGNGIWYSTTWQPTE